MTIPNTLCFKSTFSTLNRCDEFLGSLGDTAKCDSVCVFFDVAGIVNIHIRVSLLLKSTFSNINIDITKCVCDTRISCGF